MTIQDYPVSPNMGTSEIREGGWRAPDLGQQTIGGDPSPFWDYLAVGTIVVAGGVAAVVFAPIWVPLVALGWAVCKVIDRLDR